MFRRKNKAKDPNVVEPVDTCTNHTFWGSDIPGKLLEKWPQTEGGAPENPAFLTHLSCVDMADDVFINMLNAYGIPSLKCYPGDGSFGKVIMGMSGDGADIFVPTSMLDEAKALMGGNTVE